MKNLDDLLKEYGGVIQLAEFLGLSHQAIYKWIRQGGTIPETSVYRIQAKTAGRFNADEYLRETGQARQV